MLSSHTELRNNLRVLSGRSNPKLAQALCDKLGISLCKSHLGTFANGEISIKVLESIRGDDVFVTQSTCGTAGLNVNQAVIELLLTIHTLKLSSAGRVFAVIPHFGYARQDRKFHFGVPISASAIARMIVELGVTGVVTIDLHSTHIQGFFHDCPVTNLSPVAEFSKYALQKSFDFSHLVVVAPDAGAVTRARRLADKIGAHRIVTILKRRVASNASESMQLVGDVKDCVCVIIDDIIDTAATLCKAADILVEYGALEVHAWATHGILTDPACERINKSTAIKEVVITDTIPQPNITEKCSKIKVISMADLLAEAVQRLYDEKAINLLHDYTSVPSPIQIDQMGIEEGFDQYQL